MFIILFIFLSLFSSNEIVANTVATSNVFSNTLSNRIKAFIAINPPSSFHPNDNSDGITSDHLYQIFNTLFWIDYNGELAPCLATKWKRIDQFTIEVELRRDVFFHNGEHFDSKSVQLTFDLFTDQKLKVKNRFYGDTISSVKIIDQYKVQIKTKVPDGLLPYRLAVVGLMIPAQYYKKVGYNYFSKHPIGTGPFQYNSIKSNSERTVLDANKKYWDGIPKIDQIEFLYFKSVDDAVAAFKKGKIDFIAHVPGKYTKEIMKTIGLKVIKKLVRKSIFLLVNTKKKGILNNYYLRSALHTGINIEHILKYGYNGNGRFSSAITVKGEPFHDESLQNISHNVKKAKELIKKSGYNQAPLVVLVTRPYDVSGSILAKQFEALGLNITVRYGSDIDEIKSVLEKNIMNKTPDVDFLLSYCVHRYALGAFPLMILFHSKANWSLTLDPKLDKLLDDAVSEFDFNLQKIKFKKVVKYIYENELVIPLFQLEDVFGVRNNIVFKPHLTGSIFFQDVEIVKNEIKK